MRRRGSRCVWWGGAVGALLAAAVARPAAAQPPVAREFRAAWVATVDNIDWPSRPGLSVAQQQAELVALLDRARALGLNAVIFQVRPAADAFYRSSIEPWSEYLTGRQGQAPSPVWDPLQFAVDSAHARGLELHAWFNPYRARHVKAIGPRARSHIARTRPALVKAYGGYLWMDPGEPAVRRRTVQVVLDVVRRYDIDGVHLDDYFYPYPVAGRRGGELPFPDDASWRRYRRGGGRLARDDWRRANVDSLVRELHRGIRRAKPHVKFGISPFGIWRPGYPASVRGFDAYAKLYADARTWWQEGWLDYLTPQLYWPIAAPAQSYPTLLRWWADENARSRHLWVGNYTSRVRGDGSGWPAGEVLAQVRATREDRGASGNVHFSMKALLDNVDGLADSLRAGLYAEPALVPASPWLDRTVPPAPRAALVGGRADAGGGPGARSGEPSATAPVVEFAPGRGDRPAWWVVRLRTGGQWAIHVLPGRDRRFPLPGEPAPDSVLVSSVSRTGIEGPPALARGER